MEPNPQTKARAESMVEAVKNYVARALDARYSALHARIKALEERPVMQYRGVWSAGRGAYPAGSFATHDGSVWYAHATTTSRPGADDSWTLAVKHGRDLR